jgi:putative transposase
MERIPASERTREQLKALMEGRVEAVTGRSELVRLAARLIIEEALEGEARDALGRDYYARGASPGAGYRNGHRSGRLKSAEGAIEYSAPQIADRAEPFRSRLREILGDRTEVLESLAVEMYARGLSTRDIEALFADEAGKSLLSRTAVSEITERLWAEYEAFASRDLSEFEVVYLFVDGIAERLHLGQPREAVLAAWGILADGKKALLHLAPGTKEDTASCREFFQDLRRRGLPDPLLVASDGAPGVIRAIEECFPRAVRQRCLAHKLRNLLSKVPEDLWPEFKARAVACYQAASPALARLLRDDIAATYGKDLPSAVACLDDDFEACIAQLRFPLGHRRAIRTTNLLERLFGEERRRTKVIPHAFGERAVLKLMYAALIRAAERWRGLRITEFERRQLRAIRDELDRAHAERTAPAVSPNLTPSPTRLSSKNRT